MDLGRRRAGAKTGVVAGSVWETRMRSDEVRGGIKVFNGDDKAEEPAENCGAGGGGNAGRSKRTGPVGSKRKTWKPESGDGPVVQVPSARARGELSKSSDEVVEKKSPAVARKGKRDAVPGADQAVQRSPVQVRRSRSEGTRGSVEKSLVELRKVKSDSAKVLGQSRRDSDGGKSEDNAVRLSTASSQPPVVLDGSRQEKEEEEEQKEEAEKEVEEKEEEQGEEEEEEEQEEEEEKEVEEKEAIDGSADEYEEDPVGESRSDEIRKEVISSDVIQVKSAPKEAPREDDNNSNDNAANNLVEGEEGEEGEEFSEESEEGEEEEEGEGEFDEGAETEPENKRLEIKEMVVAEKKTSDVPVKEETKPVQVTEKPKSIPPIVKKQPSPAVVKPARVNRNIATPTPSKIVTSPPSPSSNVQHKQPQIVLRRSSLHQNFAAKTNSFSEKYQSVPQRQNKLQSLVDLVMWRDASRSTLIFGLGTFVVISSSYTKDISISSITVISYLGLFYLAAIFLYRSIICRGYVDVDDSSCVLREEEAIWLLKVVLPYLNEFLLKLKALFSGDPGTTMKLAVLLFVLARCGNSITIWKMAKFGFFGAFTVPKVCSSYSGHITAYGKFWIRRFRDAWNSCSHKKAVAVGIFTLVWNLCSVVARIWAVFMLYVAFRYYQQNLVIEDWPEDDECVDDKCQGQVGGTKNSCGPKIVESSKGKKAS